MQALGRFLRNCLRKSPIRISLLPRSSMKTHAFGHSTSGCSLGSAAARLCEHHGFFAQHDHAARWYLHLFDNQRYTVSEAIDVLNDHLIPAGAILIRNEQRLVVVSTHQPVKKALFLLYPYPRLTSSAQFSGWCCNTCEGRRYTTGSRRSQSAA